jgi:hypothetical protein
MEKLNFVGKNWPNDTRASCKFPSDLEEFIEMDEQLKEELQELEGEFEWDKILNNFFKIMFFSCFASNFDT